MIYIAYFHHHGQELARSDDDDIGDDYDDMPSDDDDEVEALTPAHRWQHRHHKHWPPQCRAGHTSLGGYNCKLDSHQLFVFCFILSCGDEQNIFLLERASSMPDSSKPRSIKSIT